MAGKAVAGRDKGRRGTVPIGEESLRLILLTLTKIIYHDLKLTEKLLMGQMSYS